MERIKRARQVSQRSNKSRCCYNRGMTYSGRRSLSSLKKGGLKLKWLCKGSDTLGAEGGADLCQAKWVAKGKGSNIESPGVFGEINVNYSR